MTGGPAVIEEETAPNRGSDCNLLNNAQVVSAQKAAL